MDLTLKNTSQNQHFNIVFAEKPVLYNTKSTCLPRLGLVCPKMVLGHNLHHMAPFPNPRAGFCMVFRRASFIFLVPGTTSWTRDPILGLGFKIGLPTRPGRCFEQKRDAWKTWFCLGIGPRTKIWGNPVTQMDCMVSWRCLGEAVSPQTPPKKCFWGIFPIFGNLG